MEQTFFSLESEAEKWAGAVPRPTYRLSRTEKIWFYRSYQGGEPYAIIDWRQSARGDTLWVREHEPVHKHPLFLWTENNEDNRDYLILLLALARLLIHDDREVSWLDQEPVLSTRIGQIEAQCAQSPMEEDNPYLQEGRLPHPESCLVLAAPFADNEDVWAARLKLFAAQGGRGILIDLGEQPLAHDGFLLTRAKNLEWPVLSLKDGQSVEALLPELHAYVLKLTL